jgi:hypothetical protein
MRESIVAAIVVGVLSSWVGAAYAAETCNRDCLIGALDGYLAGVIAHAPSKAALADTYRETENAVVVKPGEGMWTSATGLGALQRRYADPDSMQAGYFGIIGEAAGPAIVSVRVKVAGGKITEGEWIIARKGMALYNPEGIAANPPPKGPVDAAQASSRAELVAAADSYFSGIAAGDGNIVHALPGCYRVENGTWMIGRIPERPEPVARKRDDPAPPGAGITAPRMGTTGGACNSGLDGLKGVTAGVIDRHYLADVRAGIAWGTVIFARAEGKLGRDGKPLAWLYLTEIFKVENGKIRGVFAAMHYLPPEIKTSGWPGSP